MTTKESTSKAAEKQTEVAKTAEAQLDEDNTKKLHAEMREFKKKLKEEREKITIFAAPFTTVQLCVIELFVQLGRALNYLKRHYIFSTFILVLLASTLTLRNIEGPHQEYFDKVFSDGTVAVEWIILGVLSSVGLGTGLHTFMLYLGPFIAKVTLAATECNSANIAIRGANAFLCPTTPGDPVTFWNILRLVQFDALCWGFGTAIGELPPYFVARAARLSGKKLEDDEEEEAEESNSGLFQNIMSKAKVYLDFMLGKFAFISILVLASVPNPFFDLAGLTCGYSLIPFWTFFGATAIGKAVVKAHIQAITVILMFSKNQLEWVISTVETLLPFLKGRLQAFFDKERAKFHPENMGKDMGGSGEKSILARIWDLILFAMLFFFAVSIINSTAQSRKMEEQTVLIEDKKKQLTEELLKTQKKGATSNNTQETSEKKKADKKKLK